MILVLYHSEIRHDVPEMGLQANFPMFLEKPRAVPSQAMPLEHGIMITTATDGCKRTSELLFRK